MGNDADPGLAGAIVDKLNRLLAVCGSAPNRLSKGSLLLAGASPDQTQKHDTRARDDQDQRVIQQVVQSAGRFHGAMSRMGSCGARKQRYGSRDQGLNSAFHAGSLQQLSSWAEL